jgi:hypothetical protein
VALPASQPSIDTCNACGKLFPRVSMRLCTACSLKEEHRFDLVRQYVKDHDGASVVEIARGTGISGSDVRKFLDGGRLVEIGGGAGTCTCGGVGTRCKYCRSQLSEKFRDMEATMSRENSERPSDERRRDAGRTTGYVRRIRRINEDQ